jgi:polyisoprenoid-binding protein YceI
MSTTVSTPTLIPAGAWNLDPSHSTVGFSVKHLGIATVRGGFTEFAGTLEIGETLEDSRAYGTVKVASVDTHEPQRDDHLRSPDFFDAERHPEITFESTRIEARGDERFEITGNLTMHGVTGEIVLHGELQGTEVDPWGNERAGLEVIGELSRGDYGMKFNQALGSGNVLVSDRVRLALDVAAVRQVD